MRFSIWSLAEKSAADVVRLAQHAERTGWDGVWVADHFMPDKPELRRPRLESWSLVSALAAAVPRIRIGTLVSGNTYRHPAVLAKAAVTADHISGGRIVLGLGAGWQENEHRAYGFGFPTTKQRLERLDEACRIIRSLLANDFTTFVGKHYQVSDAPLEPKPIGPLPLLVGGGGERVTMRIAAAHADEWNAWGTPDVLAHKRDVLDGHCEAIGRDPADLRRSAQALILMSDDPVARARIRGQITRPERTLAGTCSELRDRLVGYVRAGVDEFVVPDLTLGPTGQREEAMDRFLAEVAAPFRDPMKSDQTITMAR